MQPVGRVSALLGRLCTRTSRLEAGLSPSEYSMELWETIFWRVPGTNQKAVKTREEFNSHSSLTEGAGHSRSRGLGGRSNGPTSAWVAHPNLSAAPSYTHSAFFRRHPKTFRGPHTLQYFCFPLEQAQKGGDTAKRSV